MQKRDWSWRELTVSVMSVWRRRMGAKHSGEERRRKSRCYRAGVGGGRGICREGCVQLLKQKQWGERERGRESAGERAILTHISITMQCQWSVCEASCCLVTALLRQHQCVFTCVILTDGGGRLHHPPTAAAMSAATVNKKRSHPGLFSQLPPRRCDTICSRRCIPWGGGGGGGGGGG